MVCPSCGTESPAGARFCGGCGDALSQSCGACGAANEPSMRFCIQCGSALAGPAAASPAAPAHTEPAAERRHVSILFADLVGFTTLSESRDNEEMRELLSAYFERSRTLIERYGGTVEKFIGDAVMAVWGTPVATEDDAERAVRSALDLVAAVQEVGAEAGAPQLRARAGVLTGEAAVTLGAEGQGMVAGDLVNTASRIQSAAEPGTVLVGEATKWATEAAIAYSEARAHELKGKAEAVPLFQALRVTAARGGLMKATGLEPPFVGRERELRLVKELFHACAEEKRAQLLSVVGIAGIGKSRLAWEFEKYIDGLAEDVWWHRGRCLAYGEGVTYWAFAEMVRMRAEIVEGEAPDAARGKLRTAVEHHVADADEREWIEPRLAHLLGLAKGGSHERDDLFAAWRLFLERMSETGPLAMVFEDMQWADASLLEFVGYVLEWSKGYPIFVLVLTRPELHERHPGALAAGRSMSIPLEPLPEAAMVALLSGLVPGLPGELQEQILARAEGVPLYAVETVRMLLDRGLLARDGDLYRPTGTIEALEIPETLQALVASRLDGLGVEERRLLQDASVLGKTFTRQALAALNGATETELEPLLSALVRKEVLLVQADPRSPERGQYGFVQDLLKRVAYETLAKRERKARHLAAAAHLEAAFGTAEQEVVEVVASHYLSALETGPEADDAAEIQRRACALLAAAGERAGSLGASEEAARYFEQSADLAPESLARAELLERAGRMAWAAGHSDTATTHLERAIALFEAERLAKAAARVSAHLGEITWAEGHIDRAIERMETSFAVLAHDEPDEDLAVLAAELGRLLFFTGALDRAAERIEQALELAESLGLPEVLSQALTTKSFVLDARGRPEESLGLVTHALRVAVENDVPSAALRAQYNLSNILYYFDRPDACLEQAQDGLALARRLGDRTWEWNFLEEMAAVLFLTGRWDEALERAHEVPRGEDFATYNTSAEILATLPQLYVARGQLPEALEILAQYASYGQSADLQQRTGYQAASAIVLRSQGKFAEALGLGRDAFEARGALGARHPNVKFGFVEAIEAAFELADLGEVDELLAAVGSLHVGEAAPFLRAQEARFSARLATARGDFGAAEAGFTRAAGLFREVGLPFWLAASELEHGEWLATQDRAEEAEPLLTEARDIFERLGAIPWVECAEQASRPGPEAEVLTRGA